MTEALLSPAPRRNVLEIGTGCRYQTAVLSPLWRGIHIEESLPCSGERDHLERAANSHVNFRHDDGNIGWPARAPLTASS